MAHVTSQSPYLLRALCWHSTGTTEQNDFSLYVYGEGEQQLDITSYGDSELADKSDTWWANVVKAWTCGNVYFDPELSSLVLPSNILTPELIQEAVARYAYKFLDQKILQLQLPIGPRVIPVDMQIDPEASWQSIEKEKIANQIWLS